MPAPGPALSRREVLRGAAAVALLGATTVACGNRPPPAELDDLQAQLDLAQKDSDMAEAAARVADAIFGPALTVVAEERAAHAKALAEEIARVAGSPTPTTTSATTTSAAPAPPPSVNDVRAALRGSADSAAQLAAKVSGYRAGLLGSIAASCRAAVTVPLAVRRPAA